jgi:glycosyltransferase involved in cell wall biosynthesis
MRALAAQDTDAPFAVILVLDRCTDATEERARQVLPGLHVLHVAGGVGHARRAGMDLALTLLEPDGLIATTDADSQSAPDWLRRQLEAVERGARAIGGRVELGAHTLPPGALARASATLVRASPASRARARASTTSSAARRSRSPPPPTRRSGSSRRRRSRTRASSARWRGTGCRSSG